MSCASAKVVAVNVKQELFTSALKQQGDCGGAGERRAREPPNLTWRPLEGEESVWAAGRLVKKVRQNAGAQTSVVARVVGEREHDREHAFLLCFFSHSDGTETSGVRLTKILLLGREGVNDTQ